MNSHELDAPLPAWVEPAILIQPALWLLIFGNVFSKLRAVPTGDMNYLDYW